MNNKDLKKRIIDNWRKYHSCCDWFYENLKTKESIMFCGLDYALLAIGNMIIRTDL